jgi:hypothetical protein
VAVVGDTLVGAARSLRRQDELNAMPHAHLLVFEGEFESGVRPREPSFQTP